MWLPVLEAAHYAGNGLVLAEGSHRWSVVSTKYRNFRDLLGFIDIADPVKKTMMMIIYNLYYKAQAAQGAGGEWNLEQLHFQCLRPASGPMVIGDRWEEKMGSNIFYGRSMLISAGQVLNLYKRLGGMGRTIKPTLHPGDVLIFNKCLVHRFKLVNVNMKISSINQCGGEYYRLYFTASPPNPKRI